MSRTPYRTCALFTICALLTIVAHAAQVLPEPAVDLAASDTGSVQPQPVQPRARTTSRLVYSCIEPGLVTYSDRPCGASAAQRELKVPAPVLMAGAAPDVGRTDAAVAADRQRTAAAAAAADANAVRKAIDHAETCAKLEAAVDEVDSLMRAGYPAREAGRLWERWREARARLREARC